MVQLSRRIQVELPTAGFCSVDPRRSTSRSGDALDRDPVALALEGGDRPARDTLRIAAVVAVDAGFLIRGLPREDMVDELLYLGASSGDVAGTRRRALRTILLVGLEAPLRGSERAHANFSPDSGYQKPAASAGPRRAGRIADLHAARVGAAPMTISVP